MRTDSYKILQNDKVVANKLENHPYNGKEWYEVILKKEEDIETIINYIMQVYRNI